MYILALNSTITNVSKRHVSKTRSFVSTVLAIIISFQDTECYELKDECYELYRVFFYR
jgi:hypothetical protein